MPETGDYITLISVDGVDADEIVRYAREQSDDWENTIAEKFPTYIAALAKSPCFLETGNATVDYADLQTCEVMQKTLAATSENYNEAVRIEGQRREVQGGNEYGGEEDEYETVDDEESDDESSEENGKEQSLVSMIGNQMEVAIYIAAEMGLTPEEIHEIFRTTVSCDVPLGQEECLHQTTHHAVKKYLMSLH
eukprot:gene8441-5919_t